MLPKRTRAFPVGAKRSVPSAFICGDFKKALTTVVLPVPAGPASTERRLLQLKEYKEIDDYLRKILKGRASKDVKSPLKEDWNTIVKASIDGYNEANERCRNAVADQVKALEMFCSKRLSLLAGPAGTGKTTVVKETLTRQKLRNS